MPPHESTALGLLQVRGRASPRATTVGERVALSVHPTIANYDAEWIPPVSHIVDFVRLSTPRCPTLAFSRPPTSAASHSNAVCRPRRSPLPSFCASSFSGIARSCVSPRSLLLRHAAVTSYALLGFFGLEGFVAPIGFQPGHTFVVASTVHGLHVLDSIQGGILSLPIQFLFLFFLLSPLGSGSARSWHIHVLIRANAQHTRPPTPATFGTDWASVEPGHDGPAVVV